MRIKLQKFGQILTSRPAGREAWLAAQAYLLPQSRDEKIEVDFTSVEVLTPSWADEFITQLEKKYPGQVKLLPSDNPTVKATLKILRPRQQ